MTVRNSLTHQRPFLESAQGFDRGLPLLDQLLGLWKLGDVSASVFEGDELATVGKGDRIVKRSFPAAISLHAVA
jgi:hypothetical protein